MFMANSKAFLGTTNITSIKLGTQDGKLYLGETLLYPLEKPIADAVVTCDSVAYNGSNQVAQNIVVTLSGETLIPNTDYTVTENTGGTNVGTYSVVITGTGNYTGTKSGTFTISKVTPTVTAPTAKVLTYDTQAQELVNSGSTNFGVMKYSLDNSTWSISVPTATNYGSYTVYYKVEGDSNINDVATQSISCSINERQVTATVELSQSTYTYNGSACQPTATVKDGSTVIDPSEYTVAYINNVNAGTATVTISDNVGGNYEVIGSTTFTINKVTPTVTAPTAKSVTYNGSSQALVNAASTNWGTLKYSTDGTNYSTAIPSGTTAGSYTVYYKVDGDSNINSVTAQSISATIAKADQSAPTATGATTTYNTTATATASGGGGQGSIEWSNGNTQTSVGSKTTKARWSGNSNYNASPYSNEVTLTMNKATGSVSTAPVNNNYTYNGTARAVASAGSGTGTMYYRLGTSGSFSTTMPTMTNASSSTLYYYAAESTNYTQSTTSSITVSVQKAGQAAPTATGATTTYNTTATATASGGGGQGSIEWESAKSQTSVGSHTTRARWTGNSNYNASPWSSYVTVQMNKAAGSVTINGVSLTFNNTARNLATVSNNTGTMHYSTNGTSWSTSIPTATNAGS